MSEATARPWCQGGRQTSHIYEGGGRIVAETVGPEVAALIVHRVNAHDALVAALEAIQVQTQDPAIERLCAAALPEAQR